MKIFMCCICGILTIVVGITFVRHSQTYNPNSQAVTSIGKIGQEQVDLWMKPVNKVNKDNITEVMNDE